MSAALPWWAGALTIVGAWTLLGLVVAGALGLVNKPRTPAHPEVASEPPKGPAPEPPTSMFTITYGPIPETRKPGPTRCVCPKCETVIEVGR